MSTFVGFNGREWREFVRTQNQRRGGRDDFDRPDPFDEMIDHDDDETDDYALYRLGID